MADRVRQTGSWMAERWRPLALGLAGLFVANLAAHVLLVRPQLVVTNDSDDVFDARRSELAELADEVHELERATSKLACTRSDIQDVFENLLSSKGARLTAVLKELRDLASKYRMAPDRIQYSYQEDRRSGLIRATATFPLEAPYETLREFLKQVESSPNFLLVEDVSLTGERALGRNLFLQVGVATYFAGSSKDFVKSRLSGSRRR